VNERQKRFKELVGHLRQFEIEEIRLHEQQKNLLERITREFAPHKVGDTVTLSGNRGYEPHKGKPVVLERISASIQPRRYLYGDDQEAAWKGDLVLVWAMGGKVCKADGSHGKNDARWEVDADPELNEVLKGTN
jgi:hypothetical protein